MPWDAATFHQHNHAMSPAQSLHAAHIANAILRRSGDEGMAIATANHLVRPHRDGGGMIPATPSPGLQPSVANQSPLQQGMIQRLAAMSPEQLRELMPRLGNSPVAAIAQRVLQQKQMTPQQQPPQQATPAMPQYGVSAQAQPVQQAPLQQQAMGGRVAYASGGGMRPREDCVPILAAGGEFVIAPHHVARLGQGDVKAGHKWLDEFVVTARKKIVKTTQALKPPVKS